MATKQSKDFMNRQHIAIIVEFWGDRSDFEWRRENWASEERIVWNPTEYTIKIAMEFLINGRMSLRRSLELRFNELELHDTDKLKKRMLNPENHYFKTELYCNESFDFKKPFSKSVTDPGKVLEWLKWKADDFTDTDYSEVPQKLLNQSHDKGE